MKFTSFIALLAILQPSLALSVENESCFKHAIQSFFKKNRMEKEQAKNMEVLLDNLEEAESAKTEQELVNSAKKINLNLESFSKYVNDKIYNIPAVPELVDATRVVSNQIETFKKHLKNDIAEQMGKEIAESPTFQTVNVALDHLGKNLNEVQKYARSKTTKPLYDGLVNATKASRKQLEVFQKFIAKKTSSSRAYRSLAKATKHLQNQLSTFQNFIAEKAAKTSSYQKIMSASMTLKDKANLFQQYIAYRAYAVPERKGIIGATRSGISNLLLSVSDFFIPTRWTASLGGKTGKLFYRQYREGAFQLLDNEIALLKKKGLYDKFIEREAFILKNPNWIKDRRFLRDIYDVTTPALFALAAYSAIRMESNDQSANGKKTFKLPPIGKNEVQLLSETAPFPHMAIRIDGSVYSYGVDRITVTPAELYLAQQIILHNEQVKQGKTPWLDFGKFRSVQMATISLSEEEKNKLKLYLIQQTDKVYLNDTHANDCSSMIARALNQNTSVHVPQAVDPSPSLFMEYFTVKNATGDPHVKSVSTLTEYDGQNPDLYRLRNLFVNFAESRLYTAFYPFNQARREWINHTKNPEELAHWDKAALETFQTVRDNEEKKLNDDPEIYLCNGYASDGTLAKNTEELQNCLDHLNELIQTYDEDLKSPNTDYYDRIKAEYGKAVLQHKVLEYNGEIKRALGVN